MPTETTSFYQMSGWVTQDIYSMAEMAEAVERSEADLRLVMEESKDTGLYYVPPHLRIFSRHTSNPITFNRPAYVGNIRRYQVVKWLMSIKKWDTDPEAAYSFVMEYAEKIEDEQEFLAELDKFLYNWRMGNTYYHHRIKWYVEHVTNVRRVWRASNHLLGTNHQSSRFGVRFFGPDEPKEGTFIPWEWLRLDKRLGFYDQRHFPQVEGRFLPDHKPEQWQEFSPVHPAQLLPGDLVAGEFYVSYPGGYDQVEFVGMVISADYANQEVEYTDNGRYLGRVQFTDIKTYIRVQK